MSDIIFKRLEVGLWRQFESVAIDFHPRLTVITGANGAGKSTLISLLSQQLGWARQYLSVPLRSADGSLSYRSGLIQDFLRLMESRSHTQNAVGSITYSNESKSTLAIRENNVWQTELYHSNAQPLEGMLIDSHRPNPVYSPVATIPMQPVTASQSFQLYNQEMLTRFNGGYTGTSPVFRMKEALIAMGIFGEGNKTIGGGNSALRDTFVSFNQTLRDLLPESLGFRELAIRPPEVVLATDTGDFMIDASSGGIMAIIDVAWRIHMFSQGKQAYVVLMDEPENHLHPSMQRTLMRRLLKAFPTGQFVVATHSPFMVSSVKDSHVYVLRYRNLEKDVAASFAADVGFAAGRKVVGELLSRTNKAGSASDVFREVLGVPVTMPEWVEIELEEIVGRYRGGKISSETLDSVRLDLARLGYGEYFTDAVGMLTAQQ